MNGTLTDILGALSRGADGVLPLVRGGDLIAAQHELETLSRTVLAAQVELDAALDETGTHSQHGYSSLRSMLIELHRLTPRDATAREQRRDQLCERRSLSGEVLPPRLPETALALAAGAIGAGHVEVIAHVMRTIPDALDPATCASVEQQVAAFARHYTPRDTGTFAAQLVDRLTQDGDPPADPDDAPLPDNTLHLGRSRRGRLKLTGEFDATGEAALRAMLDALAKPCPVIEGICDERTLPARQGDALVDAALQVLGFAELPDCGGQRPHLAVTVSLDELEQRIHGAMLDYGHTLHPETARMLACDAQVIPLVLGGASQPLDVGRTRRTATRAQRRALIARSGGCCEMPGCGRPASWCDAHHLRHWVDGGPTDLTNLLLLCRRHHVLIHRPGWYVHLDPDGHPVFIPPAFLDPLQTPRPSRP